MPKVRIIDPKSGFRMNLPVPYRMFVNMFVRRSVVLKILQGRLKGLMDEAARCPEEEAHRKKELHRSIRQYQSLYALADGFDYGELRAALTNTGPYRDLVLVDIQAADGTIVYITL